MSTEKQTLVIATHNGSFHADDILGVATLFLAYEHTHSITVIRTRNTESIEQADIVLDVGGQYDPSRDRFDHHQAGGAGMRDNGIKYAAFGLVWKKYGEQVCGSREVAESIEQKMVMPVDAMDNGQEIYTPLFSGVHSYGLADAFSAFKVSWKENKDELDGRFMHLVDFAKEVIHREIKRISDGLEAKEKVLALYAQAEDKRLLVLDTYYPWESALSGENDALLVVFPDVLDGQWCVQVVPAGEHTFTSKILFPESWAGKRGEELEKVTGVTGAIFCHSGRFFAAGNSKEVVLKLADIVLK